MKEELTADGIFEAKAYYNKWLRLLTEDEKQCIIDMIQDGINLGKN